jgi:hypothetical protein
MMKKVRCDGTIIEWEPDLHPTFCDECGHETGEYDYNEPSWHGKTVKRDGKYYCSLCGEEFVGLAMIEEITKEKIIPAIVEDVFREDTFFKALKKKSGVALHSSPWTEPFERS